MKFTITGGYSLSGEVAIKGAKNAALKIIPATLLASSPCVITNVPRITDIEKLLEILTGLGARVEREGNIVRIDPTGVSSSHLDEHLCKKLRGSIVLIGPLLARFGSAIFSQPGGCLIGSRPIDDHLDVFKQMGVFIEYKDEKFYLNGKPKAAHVVLKKMSVTATENALMAAVFSSGTTHIHVAAAEPEIEDLAAFLNAMGARISGAGTHSITVDGVSSLRGVEHEVLPDRIEAGTYLIAGVLTNSQITVGPVRLCHSDLFLKKLADAGARFSMSEREGASYITTHHHDELVPQDIDPRPYPGFATDLQPQYAVLMTQANGKTEVFDTMFEGRFKYLEELKLMKARVEIQNPNRAIIEGPTKLKGAHVSSLDIRGGVAVVLAGLIAQGETVVDTIDYIDRGYEDLDGKLRALGAKIERGE